jgi:hypothetical protein
MTRRDYTEAEKNLVRQSYQATSAADLARQLGMPGHPGRVYRLAGQMGLTKWPRWPPATLATVATLHAEGLTDVDIARKTGLQRRQVSQIRTERLRLPVNAAAIYAAQLRGIASQRRTLGIRSAGELRALSHRRYAVENGWPADLRPREVQVLNALAVHGPQTLRELAERLAMATDKRNASHGGPRLLASCNGPGGTYTASLMRRGLVMRQRRGQKGRRGQIGSLYLLTAVAVAMVERKVARERECERQCQSETG